MLVSVIAAGVGGSSARGDGLIRLFKIYLVFKGAVDLKLES